KPETPLTVTASDGKVLLDTGAVKAQLGGSSLIENVTRSTGELLARSVRAYVREGDAEAELAQTPGIEVLERGPVHGVVRLTGRLSKSLDYALTVEGWAGRPELRVSLETRNSDPRAAHTIRLGELGLALDLPEAV